MLFFVYILYSPKLQRFYTGTTDNVERRIAEHNSAKYGGSFTTKGIPWEIFMKIECESSSQAYKLEAFIKKMRSSAFIKRLKDEQGLVEKILKRFELE